MDVKSAWWLFLWVKSAWLLFLWELNVVTPGVPCYYTAFGGYNTLRYDVYVDEYSEVAVFILSMLDI